MENQNKVINSEVNTAVQEQNHAAGDSRYSVFYYYWQMPEHFKSVARSSEWVQKVCQIQVIGRIHNVNYIAQPKLYHLRLLLYHVKYAKSFENLKTINSIQYSSYRQACLAIDIAFNEQQLAESLQESVLSKMPVVM